MIESNSPKCPSTPKKHIGYSKSPQRFILKKSKRRDCTPDSPPTNLKYLTDQKYNRLAASIEKEKTPRFQKKNFLTLIEESVNEVNDNYLNFLGSQSTPDKLFSVIFKEKSQTEKINEIYNTVIKILKELEDKIITYVKLFNIGYKSYVFY